MANWSSWSKPYSRADLKPIGRPRWSYLLSTVQVHTNTCTLHVLQGTALGPAPVKASSRSAIQYQFISLNTVYNDLFLSFKNRFIKNVNLFSHSVNALDRIYSKFIICTDRKYTSQYFQYFKCNVM